MDYEVYMNYGEENTLSQRVQNVDTLRFDEGSYYFYDSEGVLVFIAPMERVVYIRKQ